MALQDWGLTREQVEALSASQRAAYEAAIAEYDAAIDAATTPWAPMSGLPFPVSPDGIRAIARVIREIDGEGRVP
ncbi:hypothetical protein [Microbacterium sp. MYb62]|uniref:hypothetical protein n=1 Tax=Microbacterium sp. MYb62 TaxID=1848690 RepID=UPI000CFBF4D9|nr:hypothetical protein [Microbacterium sp. MYb62]PRB18282.1 hypothetical protein CQ042_03015 [Microbacterium sp. MYb62]